MADLAKCPRCPAIVEVSDAFCGECGAQLSLGGSTVPQEEASLICTSCGVSVTADSTFCHECGQALVPTGPASELGRAMDYSSINLMMTLLSSGEHELQRAYSDPEGGLTLSLLKSGRFELDIILTDLRELSEQLDSDYPDFESQLKRHISHAQNNRRLAFLLDISDNIFSSQCNVNWKNIIGILADANEFLVKNLGHGIKRITIIGDDNIIPMARFQNHVFGDPDTTVESDLVYSTLSDSDPWLEASAALIPNHEVGRIPLGKSFGIQNYSHYLSNVQRIAVEAPNINEVSGISAKVWEMASQAIYSRMGGGLVETSPDVDLQTVLQHVNVNAPIHYFNLHGTDVDAFWYGEDNYVYPRTCSPSVVEKFTNYNVVGVEACYGAKYIHCTRSDSILLQSMVHKTIGFLGSSKIAFGPAIPPNSLADIIVGDFLIAVKNGKSFGEALNSARISTMNMSFSDGMLIKTILSFNLFGDPAERLVRTGGVLGQIDFDELKVELPDVLQEIRESNMELDQNSINKIRSQMRVGIPELNEVTPQIQRQFISSIGQEVNCLNFTSPAYPSRFSIVYADDSGRILGEFLAK